MEVKVLVLTNQQILVSQLEEVAPMDIGDPNCKMIEPFLLKEDSFRSLRNRPVRGRCCCDVRGGARVKMSRSAAVSPSSLVTRNS